VLILRRGCLANEGDAEEQREIYLLPTRDPTNPGLSIPAFLPGTSYLPNPKRVAIYAEKWRCRQDEDSLLHRRHGFGFASQCIPS
jgi:hypothetical protein